MAGEYEWGYQLDGYFRRQCRFLYDFKCTDVGIWEPVSLFIVERDLSRASSFRSSVVDRASAAFDIAQCGSVDRIIAGSADGIDGYAQSVGFYGRQLQLCMDLEWRADRGQWQ